MPGQAEGKANVEFKSLSATMGKKHGVVSSLILYYLKKTGEYWWCSFTHHHPFYPGLAYCGWPGPH